MIDAISRMTGAIDSTTKTGTAMVCTDLAGCSTTIGVDTSELMLPASTVALNLTNS